MNALSDEKRGHFLRLPRSFSLKRKSLIRPLFKRSCRDVRTLTNGSVRIVYRVVPQEEMGAAIPIQVGFAPGRLPSAVQRNRIKRQLREVYRANQGDLVDLFSDREDALTMMIMYRGETNDASPAGKRIRADLPALLSELRRSLVKLP